MTGTAVIYARFSSSKQREASIEDQLRVCHEWCDREGYRVVAEYADYAISGRTDERPEFQRMIANAGESDIVIVYMMDRFSRDPFDAPIYKRELRRHGVRLVSACEAIPDTPEGILYEKLLEGMATLESMRTAERTRRGMHGNALKCLANGVPVYGYTINADGRYEVDESQARFVREMFARRRSGESFASIARDMGERGVRNTKGGPCSPSFVDRVISSEKYVGVYMFGDVRVEGGMPRIVSDEEFVGAQTKRAAKGIRGGYRLAGRVYCAVCAKPMQGVSGKGRGGVKYEYYKCVDKCVRAIRRDWLEEEAARSIRELIADPEESRRIAALCCEAGRPQELQEALESAERSLEDARRRMANLADMVEQGGGYEFVRERMEGLRAQERRALADIERLEQARLDPELFARFLTEQPAVLDDATILDAFIHRVLVGEDDVTLVLRYRKNTGEPAELLLQRVRLIDGWLPGRGFTRTEYAVTATEMLVRFKRAS